MKKTLALALFAAIAAGPAAAQSWPSQPVNIMVGFGPGSTPDLVSRVIGEQLQKKLGQPFVVQNRPGAGGMIGNEAVARSAPDGYTLLLGTAGGVVTTPILTPKTNFDSQKSLAPVAQVVSNGFILVAAPNFPADDLQGVIKLLKDNPGKYNYGSSGTGASPHLAAERFKQQADVDMVHVPYNGLGPAITALLGGQVQLLFADIGLVSSHIRAGTLKAIAYTGTQRNRQFPDLPTAMESGLPDFQAGSWYGILAPAGTPKPIIDKLNQAIVELAKSDDMQEQLNKQGLDPVTITSAQQFAEVIQSDIEHWSSVIKKANIVVN